MTPTVRPLRPRHRCVACVLLDAAVITARDGVDTATILAEHRRSDHAYRILNQWWDFLVSALTDVDEHRRAEHHKVAA